MINWSYDLHRQHTFSLLHPYAPETEVYRTPRWWFNWPRATTALWWFNRGGFPCMWKCTRVQVCDLIISHFHWSQTYVLAYRMLQHGVKKGCMAWTCHCSLSSRPTGGGGGFWDPDQFLQLGSGGSVTPLTCLARVSVLTPRASGKQLPCSRGGWEKTASNRGKTNSSTPSNLALGQQDPALNTHKQEHPDRPICWFELQRSRGKWAGAGRNGTKTCINLQQGLMHWAVNSGTTSFAFRSVTHHHKPTWRKPKRYMGVKLFFLSLLGWGLGSLLTTSAALQHQASLDGCPKSHGLLWSVLWYYLLNLIYSLNQGD